MALSGTLTDFGVSEIFQLIGMQGKTGVLALHSEDDTVKVYFENGCVVSADTKLRNLEDLLGSVLVKSGMLREDELQHALRLQRKTLQRLGYLLLQEEMISPQELGKALQMQVSQIVFRLFRWRDGTYEFESKRKIDYERDIFEPIRAESLLMEGARMIDEWPLLERRIPTDHVVFALTDSGRAVLERPVPPRAMAVGAEASARPEEALDRDWLALLGRIDGRRAVRDLCESSPLQEFDTYRALVHFLSQGWTEEIRARPAEHAAETGGRAAGGLGLALAALLMAASLATIPWNPFAPWKTAAVAETAAELQHFTSRLRLEHIGRAIRVFYLDTGGLPPSLDDLGRGKYLDPRDLLDPWGRAYRLEWIEGGYLLHGTGPDGEPDPRLTFRKTFGPFQRSMLEGGF